MVNSKALSPSLSRTVIKNRRLQNIAVCLSFRNIEFRIRLNNICEGNFVHTKQAAYSNNHKWLPFAIPFYSKQSKTIFHWFYQLHFPYSIFTMRHCLTHDACFLPSTFNLANGNHWVTCVLCELVSMYQNISFGIVLWNKMRKMFVSIRCVELLLFLRKRRKNRCCNCNQLEFWCFFLSAC